MNIDLFGWCIKTDLIGHAQTGIKANGKNLCMLAISFDKRNSTLVVPNLEMHWPRLYQITCGANVRGHEPAAGISRQKWAA